MSYLLDTNACIKYLNSSSNRIINQMELLSPDDIFICDIVNFELYYGAYRSANTEKNLANLAIFF